MHWMLLILLIPSCLAQDANSNVQNAWTAHRWALARETGHEQELLRMAQTPDPGLQMAALDALIQGDASLTLAQLDLIDSNFADQRLILIAKAGREALPLVWELARKQPRQAHWLTVLNLLLQYRAEGLARWLLSEWTLRTAVMVVDRDVGLGRGGSAGAGVGCGSIAERDPYPPRIYYSVGDIGAPGDVLLAVGPHPVYYRRGLNPGLQWSIKDLDLVRRDYLAAIASMQIDQFPVTSDSFDVHRWIDRDEFDRFLDELRRTRQLQYTALIRVLLERGLLTPAELPGLETKLVISIQDGRTNPISPLAPAPPAVMLQASELTP